MKKVYSIVELECIRKHMEEFVEFAGKNDANTLPRCFHFCNLIIKNINICEKNDWDSIEELSEYVFDDWCSAMEIHAGLPEYYILGNTNSETQRINKEIEDYIMGLDKLISK